MSGIPSKAVSLTTVIKGQNTWLNTWLSGWKVCVSAYRAVAAIRFGGRGVRHDAALPTTLGRCIPPPPGRTRESRSVLVENHFCC